MRCPLRAASCGGCRCTRLALCCHKRPHGGVVQPKMLGRAQEVAAHVQLQQGTRRAWRGSARAAVAAAAAAALAAGGRAGGRTVQMASPRKASASGSSSPRACCSCCCLGGSGAQQQSSGGAGAAARGLGLATAAWWRVVSMTLLPVLDAGKSQTHATAELGFVTECFVQMLEQGLGLHCRGVTAGRRRGRMRSGTCRPCRAIWRPPLEVFIPATHPSRSATVPPHAPGSSTVVSSTQRRWAASSPRCVSVLAVRV